MAAILIITLCIALVLARRNKRHGGDYVKKEENSDMELTPLNLTDSPPHHFTSHTMPRFPKHAHHSREANGKVPADHLAKLDEFSMVSAMLGPSKFNQNK